MVYAMVYEVSRALGIYAFTITRKRPDRRGAPSPPLSPTPPPRAGSSPGKRRKGA